MDQKVQEFHDLLEKVRVVSVKAKRKKNQNLSEIGLRSNLSPADVAKVTSTVTFEVKEITWKASFPNGIGPVFWERGGSIEQDKVASALLKGVRKALKDQGSKSWNSKIPKGSMRWGILASVSRRIRSQIQARESKARRSKTMMKAATADLRSAKRNTAYSILKRTLEDTYGFLGKADLNRAWEEVRNAKTVDDVMSK